MLYFHVGMHKTGTSYMQQYVFPKLSGITFLSPHSPLDAFLRIEANGKFLYSNERLAGRLWASLEDVEYSIKRLAHLFPEARILMSFRPHHSFIVSSYKQYLHQGGCLSFCEFYDFNSDSGLISRDQLRYQPRIEFLKTYFGRDPFVYLQSEIFSKLDGLLADICAYLEIDPPDARRIPRRSANVGVNHGQAKVLRWLNHFFRSEFNPNGKFDYRRGILRHLGVTPRRIAQRALWFIPDGDFFDETDRNRVSEYYAADWKYVERVAMARTKAAKN